MFYIDEINFQFIPSNKPNINQIYYIKLINLYILEAIIFKFNTNVNIRTQCNEKEKKRFGTSKKKKIEIMDKFKCGDTVMSLARRYEISSESYIQ